MNIEIKKIIDKNIDDIKNLRMCIHKNPELAYEEKVTTKRIEEFLNSYNINFNRFEGMTGGYVYINNNKEKTIGMRADIDALPIKEETNVLFKSENNGKMHACGHDVHTSIAAGVALVLNDLKHKLGVNVVIVFQPAEEANPTGGAKPVINTGIFKKYNIEEFYGLHVWPKYKVGEIALKQGALMGSSDKLTINIKGKTAHAAEPHKGVDAISIGTEILNGIEHKLRREIDPFDVALVSIGEFNSTGRYNIVCDNVKIGGTIRTINDNTREFVHKRIEEISKNTADAYNGEVEVIIDKGYSVVNNNKDLTGDFIEFTSKYLGKENINTDILPSLIGEDFSFYGQVTKALYFFLGCESEYPLHSNKFMPKEGTIRFGVELMSNYIMSR